MAVQHYPFPLWMYVLFHAFKNVILGAPVVARWVENPTSIHEDVVLIPGLAQWVKDPALP